MNPHTKVWVMGNDGFPVGSYLAPPGKNIGSWTVAECVAVPVEEWARVQRIVSTHPCLGSHSGMPTTFHSDPMPRTEYCSTCGLPWALALDTTTPTTEAK